MNTTDATRLLAEARQLEREGTPTPASQTALVDILTTDRIHLLKTRAHVVVNKPVLRTIRLGTKCGS